MELNDFCSYVSPNLEELLKSLKNKINSNLNLITETREVILKFFTIFLDMDKNCGEEWQTESEETSQEALELFKEAKINFDKNNKNDFQMTQNFIDSFLETIPNTKEMITSYPKLQESEFAVDNWEHFFDFNFQYFPLN